MRGGLGWGLRWRIGTRHVEARGGTVGRGGTSDGRGAPIMGQCSC